MELESVTKIDAERLRPEIKMAELPKGRKGMRKEPWFSICNPEMEDSPDSVLGVKRYPRR